MSIYAWIFNPSHGGSIYHLVKLADKQVWLFVNGTHFSQSKKYDSIQKYKPLVHLKRCTPPGEVVTFVGEYPATFAYPFYETDLDDRNLCIYP